jgi:hypothetical protein
LFNGYGWAEAVDGIHVGPLHLVQKLARVGGKSFYVPSLALGVDGIESQRGLTGAAQTRDHRKRVARNLDIDVLQIVLARAMYGDPVQHSELWVEEVNSPLSRACAASAN